MRLPSILENRPLQLIVCLVLVAVTVLSMLKDSAQKHNSRGAKYAEAGKYDEAIQEYKKALELKPDSPNIHRNLGLAYYHKGMVDSAIT